jgi:hypothetical protein
MNSRNFTLMTLSSIAACALLGACQTTGPSPSEQLDQAATEEGLVRVETKAVDAVYKRPEATLTAYSKLLLHPVEVQFAKNWDPASQGSALYKMNEPDREKIKTELAAVFAEVFKRDLEEGGYPLVN